MRSVIWKTVEGKAVSVDEKRRTIRHRVTREVPDRVGDIVRIAGVDVSDFMKKPAVLYGHDYVGRDPLPVIGKCLGFTRSDDSLFAATKFLDPAEVSSKLGDLVNDLWVLNKGGLMGWSIGFLPLQEPERIIEGGHVVGRDFKAVSLLEYSNVLIPAHQDAINDALQKGLISKAVRTLAPEALDAGPGEDGKAVYCRLVDESKVDPAKVRAAEEALFFSMKKLRLKFLHLGWYALADPKAPGARVLGPRPVKAFVMTGDEPTIYLRSDQTPAEIQFAAAHEAHHIWLERHSGYSEARKRELFEDAANAFAWIALKDLKDGKGKAEESAALAGQSKVLEQRPTWTKAESMAQAEKRRKERIR